MDKNILSAKNMLLIGSAGRNSGKTTVARKFIEHWRGNVPVYALKVISIDHHNEQCHKGKKGCGICTSFKGNFELIEETDRTSQKDTAQLLAGGATASFLLKTLRSHLGESISCFLQQIPTNAVIVCESNSLRHVVKPGVFLFVTGNDVNSMKPSARGVFPLADKVVTSRDRFLLEQIETKTNEHGELYVELAENLAAANAPFFLEKLNMVYR